MWKETYTEYFRVWKGIVTRLDFMLSVTGYRLRIDLRKARFLDMQSRTGRRLTKNKVKGGESGHRSDRGVLPVEGTQTDPGHTWKQPEGAGN